LASVATLQERIDEFPPDPRREVEDFVEFLLSKRRRKRAAAMKFVWAGGLSDLKARYTSVELQHHITRWRIGQE